MYKEILCKNRNDFFWIGNDFGSFLKIHPKWHSESSQNYNARCTLYVIIICIDALSADLALFCTFFWGMACQGYSLKHIWLLLIHHKHLYEPDNIADIFEFVGHKVLTPGLIVTERKRRLRMCLPGVRDIFTEWVPIRHYRSNKQQATVVEQTLIRPWTLTEFHHSIS